MSVEQVATLLHLRGRIAKSDVRTYVPPRTTHPALCLGTSVPRQKHNAFCKPNVSVMKSMMKVVYIHREFSVLWVGSDLLRRPHLGGLVSLGGGRRIVLLQGTSLKI